MANFYVYSGAAGAGTGASWNDAKTTLAAALTAMAAGDDAWVAHDHAETQASAMTLTSPGTAASPCRIICVNRSGSVPPVSADLRTTATVSTTGASGISFLGVAYTYGTTFQAGSGSSSASLNFNSTISWDWILDTCAIVLNNTSVSSRINVGTTASVGERLVLINTPMTFGSVSQGIQSSNGMMEWRNTASAIVGTVPTTLFLNAARVFVANIAGVDLSAAGSGKNLVGLGGSGSVYLFQNCKLGSSVSITTGSVLTPGGTNIRVVNCDSANTNYRYYRQTYQGTITHETTIVRSGGASDGTTPVSRKMVSTANSKFYSPLEADPIVFWNESTSSITVTVCTVTDNVTLQNTDCWIEVEYPGNASFPISTFDLSSRAADVLASGSNQATDTSTWTTTGLTTPVKQKLTATFTPAAKGPIRVKVCLAKASTTVYVDPTVGITASSRQYMAADGSQINDPAAKQTAIIQQSIGTY